MNQFFTADLHLGHGNAIKHSNRPFQDAEEMDEAIITRWNSKVKRGDHVWILGDVTFLPIDKTNEKLARLNGRKSLVLGNHDRRFRKPGILTQHFEEIVDLKEIRIGDQFISMCHYPMMSWNKSHYGSFHFHGHSHGWIPYDPAHRRIDVGVDCWDFTPVEYTVLRDKLLSV